MRSCGIAFAFVLLLIALASAAQKPTPAATTVEAAGADYQLQGEYEGMLGNLKAGLQVIALGDGRFRAVAFRGGLPGADSQIEDRRELEAQKEGQTVTFSKDNESVTVGAGKAVFKSRDGQPFELRRLVRQSPTMAAKPPAGAIVLFDGTNLDAWRPGAKMDDRELLCAGAVTKRDFADFSLHLEFILPFMPAAAGQGRANSGVYIQNRYEIQILDSFGLKADSGDCGAIYRQVAPKLNMCLPPLQWQTCDIDFVAPKWRDGKKTANARVTVKLNGVIIHDNQEIKAKTGASQSEGPAPGPIQLQNHGNPVFFRNVWVVGK